MRDGTGKRSSELDRIRPTTWPAAFTEELLHLLWIVEHTVALGPQLDAILSRIVDGEQIAADALPRPSASERKPPEGDSDRG